MTTTWRKTYQKHEGKTPFEAGEASGAAYLGEPVWGPREQDCLPSIDSSGRAAKLAAADELESLCENWSAGSGQWDGYLPEPCDDDDAVDECLAEIADGEKSAFLERAEEYRAAADDDDARADPRGEK